MEIDNGKPVLLSAKQYHEITKYIRINKELQSQLDEAVEVINELNTQCKLLKNFQPFNDGTENLPKGLHLTGYQTLTYEGDYKLAEKYEKFMKKAREFLKRIEDIE